MESRSLFWENGKKIRLDSVIVLLSEIYVLLPMIIFFGGWIKFPIAFICSAILVIFTARLHKKLTHYYTESDFFSLRKIPFWGIVILGAIVWVFLSGIGGMAYQNADHWARNPIFRDLSEHAWPIYYDLSKESDVVRAICGEEKVAFSYYFCWWLPVSLLAKIFGLGNMSRNLLLYLWAVLGVLLVIYLLCRKLGATSWWIPIGFIGFSGLDIVPYMIKNHSIPFLDHLEWWAEYFQFSANTTQLYWVFNQAIPVWILVAILLQLKDCTMLAGVGALVFVYSPWAAFGMMPIVMVGVLKNRSKVYENCGFFNIIIPLVVLLTFGSFYLTSSGSGGYIGPVWRLYPGEEGLVVMNYLLLILFEVGIYFLIIHSQAKKYEYYYVTLAELIVFPLLVIRDENFEMRGSIPALFLLMYYVIRWLINHKDVSGMKLKRIALIGFIIVGFATPCMEVNRSVYYTFVNREEQLLEDDVYSLGDIRIQGKGRINLIKDQFYVYGYDHTFFFNYLVR